MVRALGRSTIETDASKVLGPLPISKSDVALVVRVLQPIWTTKHETASRLRGRIEAILDWAKGRGYGEGENPAQWRGTLEHQLPKPKQVSKVEHHRAIDFDEMGTFMAALREQDGIAARALELIILTATRTNEVLGAKWDEIEWDE